MENQKDLSLSATAAEQLVELGTAADFGFCQSNRKVKAVAYVCLEDKKCALWFNNSAPMSTR